MTLKEANTDRRILTIFMSVFATLCIGKTLKKLKKTLMTFWHIRSLIRPHAGHP